MGFTMIRVRGYKKVIHIIETLLLNKMKLYTGLSTLSTIINYSCRTLKRVSRTKMRFVTYDKLPFIIENFTFRTGQYYCRKIEESGDYLVKTRYILSKYC